MKMKLKEFSIITLGVLLVAVALEYFFIPNKIAAGGLTGLAIVINHYIPFISTGPLVLIMDLILYAVGFMFLGRNFGVKTIYASLSLSIIMSFIETFLNPQAITNDLIIATIFGTIITALGMSLVFHMDSGTGGTDTIAKILNKFFHIDIGKSLLIVDFIVTSLGAITFGINIGLYALLAVIINGIAIDNVIAGFHLCKEVTIISTENQKISRFIMEELERGCTFLKGVGGFTGKDTEVLYAVLERKEFIKLKQYITEVDKKAFISVGEVHEVMGEGFKEI
ncbi:YitT family protein [Clostridium septicum]|uniref:YitT family protein n=1 Tax=Clostridium septicum TaxID=1504 RepID=A0A9N7JLN1_CLOSE|nr:YitT family protein [Clostridium septicum]AYE34146.1 YitT family protein [Clostridium septicum]MDU1313056.1 YitT family protein [Clostridium septicum]QAS59514.1 YitT family protein [Clostridium septicum]UEC21225.1 YitT family protein [Clostridium septicum]USS00729.1 YitT family protein [Clostridium septicum]